MNNIEKYFYKIAQETKRIRLETQALIRELRELEDEYLIKRAERIANGA